MKKTRDILTVVLFVGFIFLMLILFIILPKSEVSINEKRDKAKWINPSLTNIMNGKFEKGMEDYLADHFPYRDNWVSLNSYYTLFSGRNGVNGVYRCKDGYLINTPVDINTKNSVKNQQALREFIANTDIPITLMIVPTVGAVMDDKLPKNYQPYEDNELIKAIKKDLNNEEFIDLYDAFKKIKDNTQLYYKTDHHLTSSGAYEAYKLYQSDALDKSRFIVETYNDFYGTSYSKAALWEEKGENIELWTYPINLSVTISDGFDENKYDSVFFREHLDKPDKYPVFLDGNHMYTRIENKSLDGGKLLIIKDSYGNAIAPFLALHNNITDMVDLRYYLEPVSELVKKERYDKILIVYGISTIAETTDINILE